MLDLTPQSNTTWITGLDLSEVQTPAFLYHSDAVNARIAGLKAALGTKVIISFKASNQQDLISRLEPENYDGIEIASRGELHIVAGNQGKHFYINTPALTEQLVRAGIGAGASFIVDTPAHIDMIARLRGRRALAPVSLRLSNKLVAQVCPEAPTLRDDQFGMDLPQVSDAIARARTHGIEIDGLHLYAGPHTFRKAARFVVETVKQLLPGIEAELGHEIAVLNLGGGLEEDWPERGHDFAAYRAKLADLPARCTLVHEFGRAIFADCGAFATRVMHVKEVAGQHYAICDGGMAQAFLLAQTENMMRKYRTPAVHGRIPEPLPDGAVTTVCGSTCSRDDVIGKIPARLQVGDVLLFDNCGAYTRTYAMPRFLQLGEAACYVL